MANEIIREQLLEFLAEKYELNGGEHNELSEFYIRRNLSEKDVISTLSHFVQSKLIILSLNNKLAYLTPEGYRVAKPQDVSVKKTGNVNVSFNAPVADCAIAIGGSNVSMDKNDIPPARGTMNVAKKISILGTGLLTLLGILFSGVGTKYLPDDLPFYFSKDESKQYRSTVKNINLTGRVPYLKKLPILDNNLFIKQNYSELILGGINFKLVKFAARTNEGVEAEILKLDSSSLTLPIFDMPYLEFEYKGTYYTLEIISKITGPKDIEFTYRINNLVSPTMELRSFQEREGIKE